MANNKRTIYLGLNYAQFTGGVTEINRKMGLLDAEFKLATEQAKNYGNETDELGLKEEYLTQKIALQTQKVEQAKQAYDAAMSSQEASAKEIDELDKKLLQERTKLEQLNGQLKETTQDTDEATKSNKSFGDVIRSVANTLGINVSPAVEAVAKKFDGLSAEAGKAVIAVGALLGTLTKLGSYTAETADNLNTLAAKTGLTTTEIQKLQYASKFVDVSFDTMSDSIMKLTRNMDKARDGSETVQKAFKTLGVRITDNRGQLRDAEDVWYEVIDALGKVRNETERNALAQELFGRSSDELNPLIKAGSQAVKELGDELERSDNIMSEESIAAGQKYKDALDRLNTTFDSLKLSLGQALLPILTTVADLIAKIPTPVLTIIAIGGSLIAIIVPIAKAMATLKIATVAMTTANAGFNAISMKTVGIVLAVVVALTALAVIIALIAGKKDEMSSAMQGIASSSEKIGDAVTKAQTKVNTVSRHASGTDYYKGGKTWVGEEGPELVELPAGSKIHSANESAKMMGSVNNYYITIDAKNVQDFNHVIALAQQLPMAQRRV